MPILREGELDIITHSAEQTRRLGVKLGTLLLPGDVVCLSGDMGAGKTAFSSGIGAGWGAQEPLTSPTFNLVHTHSRQADRVRLYHLDCYRLRDADDAETIGLDDLLDADGAVAIEWPERIVEALPAECLWITITSPDDLCREITLETASARYFPLLQVLNDATLY